MKKIAISFDLDNTVFDISQLYLDAWTVTGHKKPLETSGYPRRWDFANDPAFPKPVSDYILKSFSNGKLLSYTCPKTVSNQLNALIQDPRYDVYFITDRSEQLDSYGQLIKNKIGVQPSHLVISHQKERTLSELGIQIHCDDNPLLVEKLVPKFKGVLPILMTNHTTIYNHYMRGKALIFGQHHIKIPMFNDLTQVLSNLDSVIFTLNQCLNLEKSLVFPQLEKTTHSLGQCRD